jgi:hypothetical protein
MSKKTSHIRSPKSKKNKGGIELPPELQLEKVALQTLKTGLKSVAKIGKKTKASEKPHYVNSREFEDAIRKYYKDAEMTEYLADSIRRIAYGLSFAPNFINYSYKDEMIGDAVVKMYQALKYKKFHLDKGFSPFSYFTTIAFHAFISRIKKEKKYHQLIVDYRDRHYDDLINANEEETGIRINSDSGGGDLDNSHYNQSNA